MNAKRKKFAEFRAKTKRICYFCNKKLSKKNSTVEHLLPSSRGGSNDESNLAIACAPCNAEKDNLTVQEYEVYKNLVEYLRDLSNQDLYKLRTKYSNSSQHTKFTKEQKEHYVRNLRAVRSVIKERNALKTSV